MLPSTKFRLGSIGELENEIEAQVDEKHDIYRQERGHGDDVDRIEA